MPVILGAELTNRRKEVKKLKRIVIGVLCVSVVMAVIGCAGSRESREFRKACLKNSLTAYQNFLKEYPQSKYRNEIQQRMGNLVWDETVRKNTVEGYRDFLSKYPKHKFAAEAKDKLIQLRWEEVCRTNIEEDYQSFAKEFPDSRLATEALVKAGDCAWQKAVRENSLSSFERFVAQYPNHPKADEVKKNLFNYRIEEAKKAFAALPDIEFVIWDPENSWPIFVAKKSSRDPDLPPMDLDDFIVALKVVQAGESPGVSIEPPGMEGPVQPIYFEAPKYQQVRYIPDWIKGTHFALQFFEADRMLKALGFGKDPLTHKKVTSSVSGYQTLLQRAAKIKNLEAGYFGRIWFKPKQVVWQEADNVAKFAKISMGVESESSYTAPTEFAQHFERNYNSFAREKPIYRELLRMARITGAARWLVDKGYNNFLNIEHYKVKYINCPSKTSTIKGLVKEIREGVWIEQVFLIGGVSFETGNTYLPGENVYVMDVVLKNLPSKVFQSRPYKKAVSWEFSLGREKFFAVAIPLGGKGR